LKKFNKFLKGQIDSEGKSLNPKQPAQAKKSQGKSEAFALSEEQMDKVASFLSCVEEAFGKDGDQS